MFLSFLFSVFSLVLTSLLHRSVPGGDSGELIASISPPVIVTSTLRCLSTSSSSSAAASEVFVGQPKSSCDDTLIVTTSDSQELFRTVYNYSIGKSSSSNEEEKEKEKDAAAAAPSMWSPLSSVAFFLGGSSDKTTTATGNDATATPVVVGLAHPPGYPLYLAIVRFLTAASYRWFPIGTLSSMMVGDASTYDDGSYFSGSFGLYASLYRSFVAVQGSSSSSSAAAQQEQAMMMNQTHIEKMMRSMFSETEKGTKNPPSSKKSGSSNINRRLQKQFVTLWDYVLRVHSTSILFHALALFAIGGSVFSYVVYFEFFKFRRFIVDPNTTFRRNETNNSCRC